MDEIKGDRIRIENKEELSVLCEKLDEKGFVWYFGGERPAEFIPDLNFPYDIVLVLEGKTILCSMDSCGDMSLNAWLSLNGYKPIISKIKKKRITFNHFDIEVMILPRDNERYDFELDGTRYTLAGDEIACCFEGDREKPFALVFREGYKWGEITHECWHLFFKILRYMDGCQLVAYETLESEIYAYRFTDLCDLVWETLEGLEEE